MRISAVLLLLAAVVSASATDGSSGSPSNLRGADRQQSRRLPRTRRHVYAHNDQDEENDDKDEQLQERDNGNKRMERREYNQGSSSATEETESSDADVETSDRLARREYNNND